MTDDLTNAAANPSPKPAGEQPDPGATTRMPPTVDGPPIARGSTVVLGVSKGVPPTAMGYVTVPDVSGMKEAKALTELQAAGLTVGVVQNNGPAAAGTVWTQLPAGGLGAPQGSRSVMVVSNGPAQENAPLTVLPDLVGRSSEEAQQLLQSVGLRAYVMDEYNQAVPAGRVFAQSPDSRALAQPPAKSRAWIGVLLALVAIAVIAAAFFLLRSEGTPVTVPDVVGQQQTAAQQVITDAGLEVGTVTTVASTTLKAGEVTSQTPSPGTEAKKGSKVDLVVAGESEGVKTPSVVGLTQDQAEKQVKDAGLTATSIEVYSATVAKGLVVNQSPQANAVVQPGTEVALQVSKGPQPAANVTVPNVAGLAQADAESALRKANLEPVVLQNYSQSVPSGNVISQAPAAGASVAPGTQVTMLVSKGPQPADAETVQVPNVVQQQQSKAEATLQDVGLVPNVLTEPSSKYPQGVVISQVPLAGETVAVGTNIAIIVSSGPGQ
jgi:beta-lactam-binding protein with PASTA domain